MKKLFYILFALTVLVSCKKDENKVEETTPEVISRVEFEFTGMLEKEVLPLSGSDKLFHIFIYDHETDKYIGYVSKTFHDQTPAMVEANLADGKYNIYAFASRRSCNDGADIKNVEVLDEAVFEYLGFYGNLNYTNKVITVDQENRKFKMNFEGRTTNIRFDIPDLEEYKVNEMSFESTSFGRCLRMKDGEIVNNSGLILGLFDDLTNEHLVFDLITSLEGGDKSDFTFKFRNGSDDFKRDFVFEDIELKPMQTITFHLSMKDGSSEVTYEDN